MACWQRRYLDQAPTPSMPLLPTPSCCWMGATQSSCRCQPKQEPTCPRAVILLNSLSWSAQSRVCLHRCTQGTSQLYENTDDCDDNRLRLRSCQCAQNGTIYLCGRSDGDPTRSYSGAVSHLGLWNTVLTPAQILNLYRTVVVSTASTFGAPASAPAGAQQVAATMTAAAPVYSAGDTSSMQMPAPSPVRCWPGATDCNDYAHGM